VPIRIGTQRDRGFADAQAQSQAQTQTQAQPAREDAEVAA
jgi:hypothetical protein